ncbi:MAG: crosslink repair DNA glycosylase YcaQ family protein [Ornithinimicrobium sp.]
MSVLTLTVEQARRLAVRAALLADDRPVDVLDAARRLTMLPLDQTLAIAPAAQLVLWCRLGDQYELGDLNDAVATQQIVEFAGALRPIEDITLYRAEMKAWPSPGPWKAWHHRLHDWVEGNQQCRQDALEQLRQEGPLPPSALPNTFAQPWQSTGWIDGKSLRVMLSAMVQRGEVAVVGRADGERLYDLAERVYLADPPLPLAEAEAERDRRRLRAFGIARAGAVYQQGDPVGAGQAGRPAVVEGVRGRWRIDDQALAALDHPVPAQISLLAPFDTLLQDRKRMSDLLGFEYAVEMYKPKAKRRWGYYALPVLRGDRLIGKVDATADRESGELLLHAVHEDERFSVDLRLHVEDEIAALARWLGLAVKHDPHDR